MQARTINQMMAYLVFIIMIIFQGTAYPAIIHVKTTGNNAYSGETWALAKKTVGSAISAANAGDEIWVAAGIYAEHIQINKEVALYGGFKGDETVRGQRDWINNTTALDGGGGALLLGGTVVKITSNLGPGTCVDGFTITGGHGINGGGMQIVASAPIIANNIIKKNKTDGYGAGISILYFYPGLFPEFPIVTDNVIVENSSVNDEGDGGGIAVVSSSPTIRHNVIARNEATRNGGGIVCWCIDSPTTLCNNSPTIENNFILGNSAGVPFSESRDDSALSTGGGAIFASATDPTGRPVDDAVSAPVIINNTVAANGARSAGGICVVDSIRTDLGVATITNNTVVANSGSGIYWGNTSPVISNNIVAFNALGLEQGAFGITSSTIRYNDIYGNTLKGEKTDYKGIADQTGINGNISLEPRMANYKIGDFHIQPGSPCIDAGSVEVIGNGWNDIDGQSRLMGGGVDIGADESDGTLWNIPTQVVHVRADGNDALDGLTWETAKKTVTGGIAAAASKGGEVWVSKGTYTERITIPAFVYLYGGFTGNETDRDSRNISANPTILDGDGIPTVVRSANAGYLVSRLDGFTVQNGGIYTGGVLGSGSTGLEGLGGGVYCRVSSPYISNNVIKNNSLGRYTTPYFARGGGIALYGSSAVISGNTIQDNEVLAPSDGWGGGIYVSSSMPDINGNIISQNHAEYGAAIFATGSSGSSPLIRHNLVYNNAMYNLFIQYTGSVWGAITIFQESDFAIEGNVVAGNTAQIGAGINVQAAFAGSILNNIIAYNTAVDVSTGLGGMGGGVYCEIAQNPASDIIIANNTITDNIASGGLFGEEGGGIAVTLLSDKAAIVNNLVAFNSSGVYRNPYNSLVLAPHVMSNNDVFNNASDNYVYNYMYLPVGINDISVDPGFVNRGAWDFHLSPTSACIDAGSNSAVPLWLTNDLEGNARIIDAVVDIGAYEYIGYAKPDLVVESVFTDPLEPSPNQTVNVTVTVKNQGSANTGSFRVDFYKSLPSPPAQQQSGDFFCTLSHLAAGETGICNGTVSFASQGDYGMWAQVDTTQQVTESNDSNNVFGSLNISVSPHFNIAASAISGYGNITCLPATVSYEGSSTCDIVPAAGNYITEVLIDGEAQSSCLTSYTFTNVISNHTIEATFAQMLPVRIARTCPAYYTALQTAYDAAVDGDVIEAWATDFSENVNFNRNVLVKFKGGYDTWYGGWGIIGMTRIRGTVNIGGAGSGAGTVEIGNLTIM